MPSGTALGGRYVLGASDSLMPGAAAVGRRASGRWPDTGARTERPAVMPLRALAAAGKSMKARQTRKQGVPARKKKNEKQKYEDNAGRKKKKKRKHDTNNTKNSKKKQKQRKTHTKKRGVCISKCWRAISGGTDTFQTTRCHFWSHLGVSVRRGGERVRARTLDI